MGWFGPVLREQVLDGGLSIAVTGAGSWLAQALLADLAAEGLLPAAERLRLFASSARTMDVGGRSLTVEALAGAAPLQGGPWLLLHFAFLGKERTQGLPVADFVAANDAILRDTLRLAAPARDLRMVFSSSGAAYGPDRSLVEVPDANPYGWCKVQHERQLADWCGAHGVPLVMPRIFSIGGPHINKIDSYALSSMILAAKRSGTIRIMARRPVFRSFVHVSELNGLLCETALQQPAATPCLFDTSGLETAEMADLAAVVSEVLAPMTVHIERDTLVDPVADYYVGDGSTYRTLLALQQKRIVGLHEIVRQTVCYVDRLCLCDPSDI